MRRLLSQQLLHHSRLKKFKKRFFKKEANWLYLFLVLSFSSACLNIILYLISQDVRIDFYLSDASKTNTQSVHIKKPTEVRGIYITAYTASTDRLDKLIDFVKNNGLNTVVLDLKTPNGEPAFIFQDENLKKYNLSKSIYKPEDIIAIISLQILL